jgi:hypothetical protein
MGNDESIINATLVNWVEPSEQNSSKEALLAYLNSRRGEIEVSAINSSIVIDGIPSYKAYYNNSNSDPTVDYYIVDSTNNMEYSLTCRSDEKVFNQYLPIFEEMVKSLKITKQEKDRFPRR